MNMRRRDAEGAETRRFFRWIPAAALALAVSADGAEPVRFADVTAASGVAFRHTYSPEKKYVVESMSGGVALFDYDNDGWLDLFLVNSLTVDMLKAGQKARCALYRNRGDGTFADATDAAGVGDVGWGVGCAVGDFDGDGYDDLYVSCVGADRLFRNTGKGAFVDVTAKAGVSDPRFTTGACFLDYDRDGRLDLFVT